MRASTAPVSRWLLAAAAVLAMLVAGVAGVRCRSGDGGSAAGAERSGPSAPRWVEAWRWEPPHRGWVGEPAVDDDGIAVAYGTRVALLGPGGRVRWDVEHHGLRDVRPLLRAGEVVVAGRTTVVSFDREDGRVRWETAIGGYASSPAATGDVVVVASWNDELIALDRATGAVRWRVATGPYPFGPPAVAGAVVVQAWQGGWAGFSVADGTEVWRAELPDGDTSPAVAVRTGTGEQRWTAVVLAADATIRAVDAATGAPRWQARGGAPGAPEVTPAVTPAGDVVVADQLSGLTVVDPEGGRRRWAVRGPGVVLKGGPAAIAGGAVVLPLDEGTLYTAGPPGRGRVMRPPGVAGGVASTGDGFVLGTRQATPAYVIAYRRAAPP